MHEATSKFSGGCMCGAITFEAQGAPNWSGHCHCHSCRRNTGAAFATFVGWPVEAFSYVQGTPRVFNSSPGVKRSFCSDCGTPLTYESDRFPGEVHAYISTHDDPDAFLPEFHVFVSDAISWLHVEDGLPRYAATTGDGPPVGDAPA